MGCGTYLLLMTWGMGLVCTIGSFVVQPRSQAPAAAAVGAVFLIVAIIWTYFVARAPIKEAAKKQAEKQKEYLEKESEQKYLSTLRGLEKYRKMDEADAAAYARGIEAMRQLGTIMQQSVYQEKEKDWAILGGIADGIAGPVAGIVTAANVIQDNARIREENEARRAWGAQQNLYMRSLASQAEASRPYAMSMEELKKYFRADFWKKPSEFLKMLNLKTVSIIPEPYSNAVTVKASWTRSENICIDGAIRAMLYDDEEQYLGCAWLVLPKVGTASDSGELTGICANPLSKNVANVKYEAISLWELAHVQAPENIPEYDLDEEEKLLKQRELLLQQHLDTGIKKYAALKSEENKASRKVRLNALVGLFIIVILVLAVVFAVGNVKNNKLDSIAESYSTECEKSVISAILNEYNEIASVDFSVTSVKEVKSMSGYYVASIRLDLTTSIENAHIDGYYIKRSAENALTEEFVTNNGETVTYNNLDASDEYYCQEMIYIYLNGELISEPRSLLSN